MNPMAIEALPLTVVVPSYRRERILLDTLAQLMAMDPPAREILVIDQTQRHARETEEALGEFEHAGILRWLRLVHPSIPRAMNRGLLEARCELVLFVDDDVIPEVGLGAAHVGGHRESGVGLVAGRVLQPWHEDDVGGEEVSFVSKRRAFIGEFMGGNFSVKRAIALTLGGFDENFVRVAYRFERDFAARLLAAGHRILYEPQACIRHLKAAEGGTRSFGDHLRSAGPAHSVGEYYYLLRSCHPGCWLRLLRRPWAAVCTRHHLSRPWWIPATLIGELTGFGWALVLAARGPRYLKVERSRQD